MTRKVPAFFADPGNLPLANKERNCGTCPISRMTAAPEICTYRGNPVERQLAKDTLEVKAQNVSPGAEWR